MQALCWAWRSRAWRATAPTGTDCGRRESPYDRPARSSFPDGRKARSQRHMEPFATVIADEQNQQALRDLARQLRSPVGIVPFVGAGMSAPAGFWGWTDFLLRSASTIGIDAQIKQCTDAGRY